MPTRKGNTRPDASVPGPRHAWLYALPGGRMPTEIRCAGVAYVHVETFKHDFFAATGLYRGPDGTLAVAKLGRVTPLFHLPMSWTGRFLSSREFRIGRLAEGVPGVPRMLGMIGQTGVLRQFVPGHPLGRREEVADSFFVQLQELLSALHSRRLAYVDLNKRQNILVADDGRPWLIDFQISLHCPQRGWRGAWPARWLLARFQNADRYHVLKHKRRVRPDLLSPEERRRVERIGFWIRLHRLVARPLTHLRRRLLRRLARCEEFEVAGSSAK